MQIIFFRCGKLLSALNARKVPVEQLLKEKRNAAHDPADYFEYIIRVKDCIPDTLKETLYK